MATTCRFDKPSWESGNVRGAPALVDRVFSSQVTFSAHKPFHRGKSGYFGKQQQQQQQLKVSYMNHAVTGWLVRSPPKEVITGGPSIPLQSVEVVVVHFLSCAFQLTYKRELVILSTLLPVPNTDDQVHCTRTHPCLLPSTSFHFHPITATTLYSCSH
ncbi:hypothetical protein GQ42DRAFT_34746 [Ramicandelaber brevisporus]|nr:hypothetical protein GQ42DRAFT_34746 [Ramicandelaber brevisporus]